MRIDNPNIDDFTDSQHNHSDAANGGVIPSSTINHDQTTGYVANEHIDWTVDSGQLINAENLTERDRIVFIGPDGGEEAYIDLLDAKTTGAGGIRAGQGFTLNEEKIITSFSFESASSSAIVNMEVRDNPLGFGNVLQTVSGVSIPNIGIFNIPLTTPLTLSPGQYSVVLTRTSGSLGLKYSNIVYDGGVGIGGSGDDFAVAVYTETVSVLNNAIITEPYVTTNDISLTAPSAVYNLSHDSFADYVANEHIDWTNATQNILTTGTITGSNLSGTNTGDQVSSDFDHDQLQNYVPNEHIDWTNATQDIVTTGTIQAGATTVNGTLTVVGDISQTGSTYETHAEQLYTTKDLIFTRDGAIGGLGAGEYTGFQAINYDGVNDGQLVFDAQGWARVGDVGSLQKLATIEETSIDQGYTFWDQATLQLQTKSVTDTQTEINYWTQSGTDLYYNTGNVGIGTSAPEAKLTIQDATAPTIRLSNSALNQANSGTIEFSEALQGSGEPRFLIVHDGVGNKFKIQSKSAQDVTIYDRFVINRDNGYIGINKESPVYQLDVNGSTRINDDLTLEGASPKLLLTDTDVNNTSQILADSSVGGLVVNADINSTGTSSYLRLGVKNQNIININSKLDVGIGTASPLVKTHIMQDNVVGTDWVNIYDVLGVTGTDARVSIVSREDGTYGSAVSLKESSATNFVDSWDIIRETTGAGGSLFFAYGTSNEASSNTKLLTIDTDGKVSIGSTNTVYTLTVNREGGDVLDQEYIVSGFRQNGTTNGIYLGYIGGGSLSTAKGGFVRTAGNQDLFLGTTSYTQRVSILDSGDVGIGTNAPDSILGIDAGNNPGEFITLDGLAINPSGSSKSETTSIFSYRNDLYEGAAIKIHSNQSFNRATEISFWTASTTDATERMRISSDGKIGIGQTVPPKTLTIEYDSAVTDATLNGLAGGGAGTGLLIENTNTTANTYASLDFRTFTGDARIATRTTGVSNEADMLFILDNTAGFVTPLFLSHLERVGVGTTSPVAKLDVVGNDGIRIAQDNGSFSTHIRNVNGIGEAQDTNRDDMLLVADGGILIRSDDNDNGISGNISLGVYTTSSNTPLFIVEDGGNVGIGTASPGFKFEVEDASAPVIASTYTGGTTAYIYGGSTAGVVGTLTNNPLQVRTNNTTAITVDSSQRVGIGTATLTRKLTVASTGSNLQLEGSGSNAEMFFSSSGDKWRLGLVSAANFRLRNEVTATDQLVIDSTTNRFRFAGVTDDGFSKFQFGGSINIKGSAYIYNYSASTNIDHMWFDDTANNFHFCADTTYKNTGNGGVVAGSYHVGATAGVSGSFTTTDGKTVTVTNGIVTSIV